jgi:CTP synthase (UTP-ammonia lyase)
MLLRVALIGDLDPSVTAHRAIPLSIAAAGRDTGLDAVSEWVATDTIDPNDSGPRLNGFDAVWCVPRSPYASMDGAIAAIRYARTQAVPFLGTCAGFQHALIEFARHVLGIVDANHAESATGGTYVVTALSCSLVEETGSVRFLPGSRIADAYGLDEAAEEYRCNYGLNPEYRSKLEAGGLRVTCVDVAEEVRAIELPSHPFYVATLFQPERAALHGSIPPLVTALLHAAVQSRTTLLNVRTLP